MAKEQVLAKIEEAKVAFHDALAAAQARIAADVDELKRLLGQPHDTTEIEAAVDALKATIGTELGRIDPVPEHPPAPEPEPPVE